jgi:IS30 family transposase
LKEHWSPEQNAVRLKTNPPPELKGLYVSHEQIYEYIQNEGRAPDGKYLYKYLPKKKPKRQTRSTAFVPECATNLISIDKMLIK